MNIEIINQGMAYIAALSIGIPIICKVKFGTLGSGFFLMGLSIVIGHFFEIR
jgi:hypothetical protein